MKYREKIKTRRGTIAGRNMRSLVLLGIFLILGVCLVAGKLLYERNIEVYTNYAYSYAHLIADNISGITPTRFLETQTKDAEYYNIRYTLMMAGIYQDEFRDFYLVIPTEDDLIYISEIYQNLPEGTLRAVERAVDAFVGDAPQFDDLTMLSFAYRGSAGRAEGSETEERGENENGQE